MKKHTKRCHRNPFAAPIWRGHAMLGMASELRTRSVAIMLAEHGSHQRELLAFLGKVVGLGAEVAAKAPGESTNARGLHQALAAIVAMACDSARWDADWAPELAQAAEVAADLIVEHGGIAGPLFASADALAQSIAAGTIRPNAIEPVKEMETAA